MKRNITSISELEQLSKDILSYAKDLKVFIFNGDLGTGKTTLIKEFCKQLGIKDQTSSPTYSIVNEYNLPNSKVYHIDLYRLNTLEEAFEVGLEDYLYSNNYCFIEWPDIANEILPDNYISITIERISETERSFMVSKKNIL